MVGYGIYIRDLVNKQIAAKDSTIETLNAQISALQANTAPEIMKAYGVAKEYAEQMTKEKNHLQEEVEKLKQSRKVSNPSFNERLSEAQILLDALGLLEAKVGKVLDQPMESKVVVGVKDQVVNRYMQILRGYPDVYGYLYDEAARIP
jgi:SMC interacting uncharacterized protein involved in chromosome segregation